MATATISDRLGSPTLLGVVGILIATGLLALTAAPETIRDMWYAVGAVYLVVTVGAGGLWWVRSRPLAWSHALGIAVLAVFVLVPITSPLFITWGQTDPTLTRYLSVVLPIHLQRFVPVAFLLPLGTAQTDRERFLTLGMMMLPAVYELFAWFIIYPERFNAAWTTPFNLVVGTVFWFGVAVGLGSLLFVLGRRVGTTATI
jgi:hypothetical protein